jgi:transposase
MNPMEQNMLEAQKMQAQGIKQRDIAEHFGVTDRTVRNWLSERPRERKRPERKSKLQNYKGFISALLKENPDANGMLIYERLCTAGYKGGYTILKDFIRKERGEIKRLAVIRFETEPGYQAQVDWIEFGKQTLDGKVRKLYAFVMLLGYSRYAYVRFTTDMKSPTLLACHQAAFQFFGGVPKEILYDNMKTAWYFDGERWVTNANLSRFANEYGFIPRRCQSRRPETKGKVERFNQYVENNFFVRFCEQTLNIDELNWYVDRWMQNISAKPVSGMNETRRKRFEEEKQYLHKIPDEGYDVRAVIDLMVSRESCITYETNRYSVPPQYIGRTLTCRPGIFKRTLSVYSGTNLIREIILEDGGCRKKIITADDREAIKKLWEQQRRRQNLWRTPRKRVHTSAQIDVAVRSPVFYEQFLAGGRSWE